MKQSIKAIALQAVAIVIATSATIATLSYSWYIRGLMEETVFKRFEEIVAVFEADINLLRQKGVIASFLLEDGNPRWLEELEQRKQAFKSDLENFSRVVENQQDLSALTEIKSAFEEYDKAREEVILRYQTGREGFAKELFIKTVTEKYQTVAWLFDDIIATYKANAQNVVYDTKRRILILTFFVIASAVLIAFLGAAFLYLLYTKFYVPLGRMTHSIQKFIVEDESLKMSEQKGELDLLDHSIQMLVAELSRARTDLESSHNQLRHSEHLAEIGNAVAQVIHEIKNRLIIIGGFAASIKNRAADQKKVTEYSGIICEEVKKLENILSGMRDFSKPNIIETEMNSLNFLIQEVVEKFQENLPDHIKIELELDPENPDIPIDIGRTEQVIINLVQNSIEAMVNGGTIKISTRAEEGQLNLEIQDNGPGIPPEIREKIFELFFTTKKEGTGLGLSICRKILQEENATICVQSSPGEGTKFTIEFPKTLRSALTSRLIKKEKGA
jgi:signal transduction histidine kinase